MGEVSHGYRTIVGFRREPVPTGPLWPAAAASQVAVMIPVRSVQVSEGIAFVFNETTEHGRGPDSVDIREVLPRETWQCQMRYAGLEELWACTLGYQAKRLSGNLMPEVLVAGKVFRHLFEVDDVLSTAKAWSTDDGFTGGELATPKYRVRRGTAAVWRQVSVWELLSSMISKMTLTNTLQDGLLATFEMVAHTRSRASAVNTAAVLEALAVNANANVLLRHGTLRVAAFSTVTPLGAGDAVKHRDWQIALDNHLQAGPGPRTGTAPEEYERGSAPAVTFAVNLERYRADTDFQRLIGSTALMADIKYVGPAIPGTAYNHQLNIYLPRFHLTDVRSDVAGQQVPLYSHQAVMEVPRAAPAGFPVSHHFGPVIVELVNTVSTHALLD